MTNDQITNIAKIVAVAVANALTQMNTQQPKAAKAAAKPTIKTKPQPKAAQPTLNDRKAAFANAVITTFKAIGLNVTPNVDVLTFGKWQALGFKPKTGHKAVFVKTKGMNGNGIPLFHQSQVEKIA